MYELKGIAKSRSARNLELLIFVVLVSYIALFFMVGIFGTDRMIFLMVGLSPAYIPVLFVLTLARWFVGPRSGWRVRSELWFQLALGGIIAIGLWWLWSRLPMY